MKTDSEKLLELYRLQRKCETRTLNGHGVFSPAQQLWNTYQKEIEILQSTLSGRAKTRIRKEWKERGMPYKPNLKKEGVESIYSNQPKEQ